MNINYNADAILEAEMVNGKENIIVACPKCGVYHLPHRVCKACGYYDGREVIKVAEAK